MPKLQIFATTAMAAAILAFAGHAALAECRTNTESTAQSANKEIVANSRTDSETGEKEAETGAAKPTENWFGCKPGEERVDGKCASAKGDQQENKAETTADEKTKSDSQAEMRVTSTDCLQDKVVR